MVIYLTPKKDQPMISNIIKDNIPQIYVKDEMLG